MSNIFTPADILIPAAADMHKWSVVACDQYTSQPEYWAEIEKLVGSAPSTLRLMLPEAYLDTVDVEAESEIINATMKDYLESNIFRTLEKSFVLIQRKLADGKIRTGLIGAVDLEKYDFSPDSKSPIRATEGTVASRLPPRVKVREGAALEMPHIMVFFNDRSGTFLAELTEECIKSDEKVYDFELSGNGGSICGYRISGEIAEKVAASISEGNSDENKVVLAIGDGNHSLATAKVCWENIKKNLSADELDSHPARFSLVELVNIHDESITFEPIHRVLFGTASECFETFAEDKLKPAGNKEFTVRIAHGNEVNQISVMDESIGKLIARCENLCQDFIKENGGNIDYVHNDDYALKMAAAEGCCSLLLPPMNKGDLFSSVETTGPFPKKSFSIGLAQDKRYYLECRKIIK